MQSKRLDVCVHGSAADLASKIQAGLADPAKSGARVEPVLVLHTQRDLRQAATEHGHFAARIDCLADLLEMGFQREATEFAHHLVRSAKSAAVVT